MQPSVAVRVCFCVLAVTAQTTSPSTEEEVVSILLAEFGSTTDDRIPTRLEKKVAQRMAAILRDCVTDEVDVESEVNLESDVSDALEWDHFDSEMPCTSENIQEIDDVIIVGAGLTGLTAARELKKLLPNVRLRVLEGRDQIGGRIRTKPMRTAEGPMLMDTGSQFISPYASALTALASELGLNFFPQTNCGIRTLDIRSKRCGEDVRCVRRMPLGNLALAAPPLYCKGSDDGELAETLANKVAINLGFGSEETKNRYSETDSLAVRHSFQEVLNSRNLAELASTSAHDYLLNTSQSKATMDTANRLLQTLFDAPANTTSILHLMLAAASENATVADMLSRYGHGQGLLMQGGLHRLIRAMMENLNVQLNELVNSIEESGSVVVVRSSKGTYSARHVIVTAPPTVANSIQYTPPLEEDYARFLESYRPTGRAYYFTMTFASPFWRAIGRNGQLIYTNQQGPIVWLTTFDVGTPTMCAARGATGVLWGIAHFTENLAPAPRRAAYIDVVSKSLGANGPLPLDVSEEAFVTDPLAQGSIAVLPPNVQITSLQYLQGVNTHGKRIMFASAEFSNSSMGLMNGAVLSGIAASEITGRRLLSVDEAEREDNEIANLIRLSDDVAPSSQQISKDSKQANGPTATTAFVYDTSTHYPNTTTFKVTTFKHFSFGNLDEDSTPTKTRIFNDEANAKSEAVETATAGSSFVYHTSTQYPAVSTETVEMPNIKHFSFGNADPAPPFVPPPPSENVSLASLPTTTTTVRSTFTPVDPHRTTTPFPYSTSSINAPVETALDTSTIKHFSFGNVDDAPLRRQNGTSNEHNIINNINGTSSMPSYENLIKRLKEITDLAPNLSRIELATELSDILQCLLRSIQEEGVHKRL